MNLETILVEKKDQNAIVAINRPKALNALNAQVFSDLSKTLKELKKDTTIRSIILTGSGDKSFVAGADIKEFADFNAKQGAKLAGKNQKKVFNTIEKFPKPIIAAINGFALGGGLELALACHIRIASDNAKLGFPETTLGLIPGYGGTQRLPQLVGKGFAAELIFSAEMIDADRALSIGLINQKTSQKELLSKAEEIANRFNKNSGNAIKNAIQAINSAGTPKGYKKEIHHFGKGFKHPDFKEGVDAFLNKRKPTFK
ncbi:MAG: enoyl-CoA hydratase-related protein [Flavobacteriales bacterium]